MYGCHFNDLPMLMDKQEAEGIYAADKEAMIDTLCRRQARIEVLEKQRPSFTEVVAKLLGNSSTSHKPPSSDIIKPNKKASKWKSKTYGLRDCPAGACQNSIVLNQSLRIVQQISLKPIRFDVSEYRTYPHYCGDCQEVHDTTLPDERVKAGLFDDELTALVANMKHVCHASFLSQYFVIHAELD